METEAQNLTQPTGAQLVVEFNQLVTTAIALGETRYRPINRFRSIEEGVKRIAMIKSSIRARQSSERAVEREQVAPVASPPVAPVASPPVVKVPAVEAPPVVAAPEPLPSAPEQSTTAEPEAAEQEDDDMARKKKKVVAKAKKPARKVEFKTRNREPNGVSIKAKTEEFNSLIAEANRNGPKKFKKHTSDFGNHEHADRMLKIIRQQAGVR
jgi:hypothetical protein